MRGWPGAVILSIAFVLTSLNAVHRFTHRYTHGLGVVAYVVVGIPVIAAAFRYLVPWVERHPMRRRTEILLALLALGALCLTFAVLYPLANSGRIGPGTDRDEALNMGLTEIFAGRYPYHVHTYLNMPLTPLPGALLMGAPFYFLGNAAYQNPFWIAILGVLFWSAAGSLRVAVVLLVGMMLACPELMREYVTGGDVGTNAIYILVLTQLLVWTARRPRLTLVFRAFPAVLPGVALSSRPNWIVGLPILLAALAKAKGWRVALFYVGLSVGVAALLTLPFYFYDPSGFSPLHVTGFVTYLNRYFPHSSHVIYALPVAASLALAVRQYRIQSTHAELFTTAASGSAPSAASAAPLPDFAQHHAWLFIHGAVVQALPVLATATLLAANEGVLEMRTEYMTSRAMQMLGTGHIYVYALVYAWTLLNRCGWRASAPAT